MTFFAPYFSDKTLITILRILPLNRDMKEEILWKIIDDMLRDVFAVQLIEEIINFDDELYYYNEYYAFKYN